ncbi:MAG TPA: hypothetical protein VM050_10575 [Patescibacteria group bacterium]|nr:hypothetical protein [Patescibacteria group bacterium]
MRAFYTVIVAIVTVIIVTPGVLVLLMTRAEVSQVTAINPESSGPKAS